MPSSPNTSCSFGDMQNVDYNVGIERIGYDQSLVRPVLSVREASPVVTRAAARGSRGQTMLENKASRRGSCLNASTLDVPDDVVTQWVVPRWMHGGRVSFCSCALLCEAAVHAIRSSQEYRFSSSGTVVLSPR